MPVTRPHVVAALAMATAVAGALSILAPARSAATVSVNQVYSVPSSGSFTARGHGYGHGNGMSQHGAQGAALRGLGYRKILDFYYPGTDQEVARTKSIRVLVSADTTDPVEVEPRSVRRYIGMLQDMGMPIEATRGPGGGYRLRPGFKLPPLIFSEEEATA